MTKKNQNNDAIVQKALEELLSLREDTVVFNQPLVQPVVPLAKPTTNPGKSDLLSLISNAKKNSSAINNSKWAEQIQQEEKKQDQQLQGRSPYDADVLRESILKRQAEKRSGQSLSGLVNAVKKNKNEYNK